MSVYLFEHEGLISESKIETFMDYKISVHAVTYFSVEFIKQILWKCNFQIMGISFSSNVLNELSLIYNYLEKL